MSETSQNVFFELVSCKQKQGFMWGAISSGAGLSLYEAGSKNKLGPTTLISGVGPT